MTSVSRQTQQIIDKHNIVLSTKSIPLENIIGNYTASTIIEATASEVWEVLTNTSTWPEWNTFCPSAMIRSQPQDHDNHHNEKSSSTSSSSSSSSPSSNGSVTQSQLRSPYLVKSTKATFNMNMHPFKKPTVKKPAKLTKIPLVITEYLPPSPSSSPSSPRPRNRKSRIAWSIDHTVPLQPPKWLYHVERVHELHPSTSTKIKDHGSVDVVEVISWDAQSGILAHVLKWIMTDKFTRCVQLQADELKAFVERQSRK